MHNDNINSPAHYTFGKIETIEVIEDWELGFHLGNAVKYIARAGRKDKSKVEEDLKKAIWYIERFIEKGDKHYADSKPSCGTINNNRQE